MYTETENGENGGKKNPNSDEHGGIWEGEEVGTCNKAEIRLWMEMQVEAAGALQPCG